MLLQMQVQICQVIQPYEINKFRFCGHFRKDRVTLHLEKNHTLSMFSMYIHVCTCTYMEPNDLVRGHISPSNPWEGRMVARASGKRIIMSVFCNKSPPAFLLSNIGETVTYTSSQKQQSERHEYAHKFLPWNYCAPLFTFFLS